MVGKRKELLSAGIFKVILFCGLSIVCNPLFGQVERHLEFKPYMGIIMPHKEEMKDLRDRPAWGGELNYLFSRQPDNVYDQKFNSPFTGVGISFEDLGNHDQLGYVFSAYTFMEFKWFRNKKVGLNTRLGGGLSYITEKYNSVSNPVNTAIGSDISFHFILNTDLYYLIPNSNFELRTGIGFLHNSTGSVKKPNNGLNQVRFMTGISYRFNDLPEVEYDIEEEIINRPHEFSIMATLIKTEEYETDNIPRDENFYNSTIALGYAYRYSVIGKVGVFADLFYNENLCYKEDKTTGELVKVRSNAEALRPGISVGHELIYKKVGLLTYFGAYTYKHVKPDEHFYMRAGIRYYPVKNAFVNLTLKCFGFKAHFIESGIGFRVFK